MTNESDAPKRIRRESIPPPEEPDETMLAQLRAQFDTLPRITEAWLTGSRLTPEDGSPSYETTDILLVLDPPLDATSPADIGGQIEELEEALRLTGYKREPRRGWVFGQAGSRERHARLIYSRP